MSDSFVTPWTVACQAPLSMGYLKQEYWSELPFPSPGHLPDPGIKPMFHASADGFITTETPGKPNHWIFSKSISLLRLQAPPGQWLCLYHLWSVMGSLRFTLLAGHWCCCRLHKAAPVCLPHLVGLVFPRSAHLHRLHVHHHVRGSQIDKRQPSVLLLWLTATDYVCESSSVMSDSFRPHGLIQSMQFSRPEYWSG